MNTKNIFKTLALAMLMPAMLLTTACSSDDDAVNNENTAKKGYTLPVTVNVTRQTTRATYNDNGDGTGNLAFSTGDQLFVWGHDTRDGGAGYFAGTLDYVPASGQFTGTITTQKSYTGTADALFTATSSSGEYLTADLLPADYEDYGFQYIMPTGSNGYDDVLNTASAKAFATSKATAVEQFSFEEASTYSSGFALHPLNAILNFTITGLSASTKVTATLTDGGSLTISGDVITNGSGEASFAMAVRGGTNFNTLSLTVGGNAITLASGSKTLEAGHVYNITRSSATAPAAPEGALPGKFTINSNGDKVYFSKGNLQAVFASAGSTCTWKFADNQWDYIGNAAANTSINGNGSVSAAGTVEFFGWVGASNTTWTGAAIYGVSNSTSTPSASTYGNVATEDLRSDWGNTMGSGWFTLKTNEWDYLFNSRTASTVGGTANAHYAKATVNSTAGVILFPDSYTHPSDVTVPASVNTANVAFTANTYDAAAWGKMESAGAVFLPAAGRRSGSSGSSVYNAGEIGYYWSSSPYTSSAVYAYNVFFSSASLNPQSHGSGRFEGFSVRLVRAAN